ncbi:hypothetical protein ES705_37813 [subsurface metagenome]
MRSRNYLVLIAAAFLLASTDIKAEKENREVSNFTKIGYSLPGDMEIVQGSEVSLILDGDKEDLEKIITKVEGNKLKIYTRNNTSGLGDVKVFITVVKLEGISVAGSGDVKVKTKLETEELDLDLSGSGSIQCEDLVANVLEVNIAGSGDVFLGGIAEKELEVNIAGSGDVRAENLKTKEAEVNIAGSGSAKVWVIDELETNIVGSGDVYYKGNPVVNAETIGSGSTKSLD